VTIDWEERARAWTREGRELACDELRPWDYGTIARTYRYPDIYDLNVVILERPCGLSAAALVALCDRELADSAHRKLDVEDMDEGRRLRPDLEVLGWRAMPLVWMVFDGPAPADPGLAVEEVPYDSVDALRREWHEEDFPGDDPTSFHAQQAELDQRRGARVLAVRERGVPVAFSLLQVRASGSEVDAVCVTRSRRGAGLGTAVTTAAIRTGLRSSQGNVWICADEEDRAWPLYERLGFRRAWRMTQFLRLPAGNS
jgi:GNAT superfamily N-acetyltransferase